MKAVRTHDKIGQECFCAPTGGAKTARISSTQARWLKTIEVFNEQGEAQQLKLFPSHVEPPGDDPQVARVLLNKVRLERTRQFGACWLGLELWRRLELDRFFEQTVDEQEADVPWSRVSTFQLSYTYRTQPRVDFGSH